MTYISEHEHEDRYDHKPTTPKLSREEMRSAISRFGFNKCDFKGPLARVTREIIHQNLEAWGFVCVKTWGYDPNNVRWSRYWSRLREFVEESLVENGITGNLQTGLALKLRWILISHDSLNDASPTKVHATLEEMIKDDLAPKGICLKIALMIDEDSVRSLLHPTAYTPSFVTAVRRSTAKGDNTVRVFRIAIKTLIKDAWLLLSTGKSAEDIDPGNNSILS